MEDKKHINNTNRTWKANILFERAKSVLEQVIIEFISKIKNTH